MGLDSIGTPLLWIGFTLFVLAMLALDLGVFHRKAHVVHVREALVWTAVWIALALGCNVGIYVWFGAERALEFLPAMSRGPSVDNIFVFLVVFSVSQSRRAATPCARLGSGALIMRALHARCSAASGAHWIGYLFEPSGLHGH
jgi:tellurite resistance protein TerC